MYGDRDFACNWIGGERAVHAVNYSGKEEFANAGYTPILVINEEGVPDIGGQTKQYGNFSFSRVYQAGHEGSFLPSTFAFGYDRYVAFDFHMISLN